MGMSTQKCCECNSSFEPQRPNQLYCSMQCTRAARYRRQAICRLSANRKTRRAQLEAERAESRATLRVVESDNQRQLRKADAKAEEISNDRMYRRGQEIDDLHVQLRKLATKTVDLCGELSETEALNTELRQEIARILRTSGTDAKDLMHLGARLLQLTDRLGIRLDEQTAQIYSRRGWPTRIPVTIR